MTGELTPPDPQPNSDETYCVNCESIVDKISIKETYEGDMGCTECIYDCARCGNPHYYQDMYSCPYFGKICNVCRSADEYKKTVKNKLLKDALRCYFDHVEHGRIEKTIIEVTQIMGFNELAREMRNDI